MTEVMFIVMAWEYTEQLGTAPAKLALFLKPEQLKWQTKAAASENC
jgi:hypothetical protein